MLCLLPGPPPAAEMTLYSSERGLQKPVELATQLNAFTLDVRLRG
ncbi:MAG: hypothetical protein MGAcid_17690 [uncultured Acidilobus sp. MG]|nr:MAG: hypothetical protein MGAcid_17690 [uncultured Acidilobus sp. MG]